MIAPEEIETELARLGQPAYRARQVYHAFTRELATGFDEMTVLPRRLREQLAARLAPCRLRPQREWRSASGEARKWLFLTREGMPVESVLTTVAGRASVCVSTQVGCAVGCAFCASGRLGLRRSLDAVEMVEQVLHAARALRAEGRRVTSVVFMGMGEPFHNYAETLRACRLLNDPRGFALAARAISVSTAGVVPGIDRFGTEGLQSNLAVSLHAATDELRDRLVPLNRRWPLDELLAATRRYVRRTGRKVMYEWVVLPGVNDGDDQVAALAERLRRHLCHVNLIAWNEAGGPFRPPLADEVESFRRRLAASGLSVSVRRSPGGDIAAACGQLALRESPVGPAAGGGDATQYPAADDTTR